MIMLPTDRLLPYNNAYDKFKLTTKIRNNNNE